MEQLQPLVDLGLTRLESKIYAFLLVNAPATGYRVSKGIGEPTANTYKALDSLLGKGAIEVDDGKVRNYRAVPAEELLDVLGRRFSQQRQRAAESLKRLKPTESDDRVYQLQSVEHIYERSRSMLERAEKIAVFDLFPEPFEELRADLERAAKRGVGVHVKIYRTTQLPGVELVLHSSVESTMKRWPGQWLNGAVDGLEYVLAYLSHDGKSVHQAVWSGSAYLSWMHYYRLLCELSLTEVGSALNSGKSEEQTKAIYQRYHELATMDVPGYQSLLQRFGANKQR